MKKLQNGNKVIIFDLDGTLLNTLGDLRNAVNFSLSKRGYELRTIEEIRKFIGDGIKKLIIRSLPRGTKDKIVDECYEEFKEYYSSNMMGDTVPYDGVLEVLQYFKTQNVKLAVLSNKFDPAAKELCENYFGDLLDVVFGERQGIPRKPDPTSVNEIIDILGVPKKNVVYVGDSATDAQTAKNAGLYCVGVTWGYRDADVIKKGGADCLVDNTKDLIKAIEERHNGC